jgi:hypothetical protein
MSTTLKLLRVVLVVSIFIAYCNTPGGFRHWWWIILSTVIVVCGTIAFIGSRRHDTDTVNWASAVMGLCAEISACAFCAQIGVWIWSGGPPITWYLT